MKKLFFCVSIVALFSAASLAQSRPSTPYPQGTPDPVYPGSSTENAMKQSEDLNRRSTDLQMTEKFPVKTRRKNKELEELIEPFYRNSTDEEREMMAGDEADQAAFSQFLRGKHRGMFKLIADRGCAANPKVVDASANCAKYTMPGAGSGYSFRFEDYRMHHISDIVFKKGKLQSLGVLDHGIMVNLGDVPIDTVNEKTEGVEYLVKIKPSKSMEEAGVFANKLAKGIKKNGRFYASILPIKEGNTYVIRSIAYDGEAMRKVGKYAFNEMDIDNRRDVLVVFRVVRLTNGDEATIVWKRLDDGKSPKLKMPKK